jgi:CheY-like chemotaxis protein
MPDVLVVDDDPTTCRVVARLLRASGQPAQCVPGGADALRYLATDKAPKVILLDVMMPDIDGMALLRVIRSRAGLRDVPVVMFSALSDAAVQDEARRLGAQGYVVKGGEWSALYEQIRQYVS